MMNRHGVARERVYRRDLVPLLRCQLLLQGLAVGVPDDLEQGDGHGEDHPHIDHLHVSCRWERTRDSDVAAKSGFCRCVD